jgi:hypothetical protein
MAMIRKQFFIDREASARLKRAAAARGVSEAELIREGLEIVLADPAKDPEDWKAGLAQSKGIWADHETIGTVMAERRASRAKRRTKTSARLRGA